MVKIPIGDGSKNVTLMVVYAHPGRGQEANAWNEHIFNAVVGLAAGLGETPLMICGDLQTEKAVEALRLRAQPRLAHGPGTDAQTCGAAHQ